MEGILRFAGLSISIVLLTYMPYSNSPSRFRF